MPDAIAFVDYIKEGPQHKNQKPFVAVRDIQHETTHTVQELSNIEWDIREVVLQDIRTWDEPPRLARDGFEVVEVASSDLLQFNEIEDIQTYQKTTEELLKQHLQADHVICYDFKMRKNVLRASGSVDINDPLNVETPPRGLHVDSSFDFFQVLIGRALSAQEKIQYLKPGVRLQVVNTWRPLLSKIEDRPLAICNPHFVSPADLVLVDRIFPDDVTESCYLRYNPRHQFAWLSEQRENELILMKQFDTSGSHGVRYCPHASFHDKSARKDAPSRESVETRSLVIHLARHEQ